MYLRRKIMIVVVVISTVCCLAMWFGLALPGINALYEKNYSLVETSINQLSAQCAELLDGAESTSYTFLGLEDLYTTLAQSGSRQYSSDYTKQIAHLRTLTTHFLNRPSIYSVAFFDARGDTLFQAINSITDTNCRPWFDAVQEKNAGKVWTDSYISQNLTNLRKDIRVISLFRPVVSPDTYQPVGSMRITILEESLASLLRSGRVEFSQSIYLCDGAGRVVSAGDAADVGRALDFPPVDDIDDGLHVVSNQPDLRQLIRRVGRYDLFVVETLPADYLQQLTHSLWRYSVVILVAMWVGMVIYAVFTSRMLAKPVHTLVAQMRRVEEGDLDTKIATITQDEIGLLSTSFNHMVHVLKTSQEALIQSRMKVLELRMQTLRLQLNPHFLLNTLDNIRWIALQESDNSINRYIESFSTILKDTLSQKRVSTVGQEIRLMENYIRLERLRFGNNLTLDYSVENALLDCFMPSFILQPILENAITHGFPDKAADNAIFLIVERQGNDLIIDISDNGVGADEAGVRQIIARNPRSRVSLLHNINERIHMDFGADYHGGVSFFSKPGMGARVKVTLPARGEAYAALIHLDEMSGH